MNTTNVIKGKSALLEAVLSGCTIHELILKGEELLPAPIALISVNCFVWYSTECMPRDSELTLSGGTVAKTKLLGNNTLNTLLSARNTERTCFFGNYHYAFSPIHCKNKLLGYSYMVATIPFVQEDLELHNAFCHILGDLMVKQEAEERFLLLNEEESVLIKILDDNYRELEQGTAETIFNIPEGRAELTVIRPRESTSPLPMALSIVSEVRKALSCDICFSYKDCIIALVAKDSSLEKQAELNPILCKYDLLTGISYPLYRLNHLKIYFQQAITALSYATENKRLLSYSSIVFKELLTQTGMKADAKILCNLDILILEEYDKKYNSSLIDTLFTYFDSGCSIRKTAETLQIHRNSVLSRMERIRELSFTNDIQQIDSYHSLLLIKSPPNI